MKINRLMERVPPFYYDDPIINDFFSAFDEELERKNAWVMDVSKQFSLLTATWGLPVWEKIYNLSLNSNDREKKISLMLNKYRVKLKFSIPLLESIAKEFTESKQVKVTEDFTRKMIRYHLNIDDKINFLSLKNNFEKIRPVYVKGMMVSLGAATNIEFQTGITVTARRYKKVNEFRLGMAPLIDKSEMSV
jgi:hypothetical protein